MTETNAPLGLYIHLPFCPSRCPYCDFFAKPFDPVEARLVFPAILKHVELLGPVAAGRELDTIYLGGGTPSMWPAAHIARLLKAVRQNLALGAQAEVSLEANPGTLSRQKLQLLRQCGINRLSLGAQSLSPRLLKTLGRRHSAQDIKRAVTQAREAGFNNLNLDIIYALPFQNPGQAKDDIKAALELGPDHLSLYELTLAPETPFGRSFQSGCNPLPSDDEVQAMENAALALIDQAGLRRYEVSNFARPGFECRHNQSTWQGGDYLALGPGAHGHMAGQRWGLTQDINAYGHAIRQGRQPYGFFERLTREQQALERVMLGLRTIRGVELAGLADLLKDDPLKVYQRPIARLRELKWASLGQTHLSPTPLGLAMADAAAALFA